MAACGSLQQLFEKPLPDNPTLLESLSSWNQIKPMKPSNVERSSFTELFGELHFKENYQTPSSITSLKQDNLEEKEETKKNSSSLDTFTSFSLMKNSDSLQLCTEGLGFESSDDVEELKTDDFSENRHQQREEKQRVTSNSVYKNMNREIRWSRLSNGGGEFPPPISCIGKTGKPGVCFKSYRQHGRFVLKQVRIPSQEFLHACREDGRLKLQFVQQEELIEESEEDDYKSEEENLLEDDKEKENEEHK